MLFVSCICCRSQYWTIKTFADCFKNAELMKVADEVLAPVSGTDDGDVFSGSYYFLSNTFMIACKALYAAWHHHIACLFWWWHKISYGSIMQLSCPVSLFHPFSTVSTHSVSSVVITVTLSHTLFLNAPESVESFSPSFPGNHVKKPRDHYFTWGFIRQFISLVSSSFGGWIGSTIVSSREINLL